MKLIKIIGLFLFLFFIFFGQINQALASEPIKGYLFYGDGCPHCANQKDFLETLKLDYPNLKIEEKEIYFNKDNAQLFQEVTTKLNVPVAGVPFLIIGEEYFIGYAKGLTDMAIKNKVDECSTLGCSDFFATNLETNNQTKSENVTTATKILTIPILGEVNLANLSLPILAIILGTLDGFNPCAMWALLFLIGLLLGFKDRKKMWLLGLTFIITSAVVYFFFMTAWLNLALWLGFLLWIRLAIGGLAIWGGSYNLNKYLKQKSNTCEISGGERQQKILTKLKAIVNQNNLYLSLIGIIVLAILINLIELICSAGLPVIFTQILALNNLASWQYYAYIGLYIFFFMIDDLLVFILAMITLQITGLTTKYYKYTQLGGGILMIIIGLLLIFAPNWLMFG